MRIVITIWVALFALTGAVFVLWALAPHRPKDIEIWLLPGNFLLLAAWGQMMHLQAVVLIRDRRIDSLVRRMATRDITGEFRHLFNGYKE